MWDDNINYIESFSFPLSMPTDHSQHNYFKYSGYSLILLLVWFPAEELKSALALKQFEIGEPKK